MSDLEATATEPIDTGAEVSVPDGEVSREQLVKILEDARAADPGDDESPDPAAAVEKPAEPEKPKAESVSARIIAARRQEMRAAKERQEIAADRAEVEKAKAEVAEAAQQAAALKAAKLSPSKALELLGMSPKEFLESLAGEHEPQAVAERAATKTMSEVEKLRAELAELRGLDEKRQQAAQRQQHDARWNEATREFLGHVETSDAYPHLIAEFTQSEIAQQAQALALQHGKAYFDQFGEYPSDAVLAEHLELQAKARAESLAERRARVGINAPRIPSQGTPAIQGQPATATKPRTLTNGASSQKATAPKPWSQKDADEESRRILQQMYASQTDD
jgi:hypothetical protein